MTCLAGTVCLRSAAVPEPILEDADARLPCVVLPGWGMTECGLLTVGRPSDSLAMRLADGRALPGNKVRVERIRRAHYRNRRRLTVPRLVAICWICAGSFLTDSSWDGTWFQTGDRAVMNDDESIRITGRTKTSSFVVEKHSGKGN